MESTRASDAQGAEIFDRFARYYDDDYRDYEADIDAILELASEQSGAVVELGCGTGRIVLPLAQMGAPVTGIDLSPALLDVARKKLAAAGVSSARLIEGDLRHSLLPAGAFAFAVCTSNTLMHLITPEDQQRVLEEAYRMLAPGGLLFVDLFNPDLERLFTVAGVLELADRWNTLDGGEVVKWSVRHVDPATQTQETLFMYEEVAADGAVKKTHCPFTLRYVWRNEGELMLRAAGFLVEEVWGDFDGSEYESGSEHLIFLARK
jgi:ubiquinone/menaquinone biosynthesis C-methylase UbiE